MNHTPNRPPDIKDEIKKGLDHLRTLRDEVLVKVHLAGMEREGRVEQEAGAATLRRRTEGQGGLG